VIDQLTEHVDLGHQLDEPVDFSFASHAHVDPVRQGADDIERQQPVPAEQVRGPLRLLLPLDLRQQLVRELVQLRLKRLEVLSLEQRQKDPSTSFCLRRFDEDERVLDPDEPLSGVALVRLGELSAVNSLDCRGVGYADESGRDAHDGACVRIIM
jgi:hypothetical protein